MLTATTKFKRLLAMPRDKFRRIYNRLCQMQASRIDREDKVISFEEYDKNHRLQIAINKYNERVEE